MRKNEQVKEKEVSQKKLSTEDIKAMNDKELKETYDKMISNYYSDKDFYDFGTENKLEEIQDELKSRKKKEN